MVPVYQARGLSVRRSGRPVLKDVVLDVPTGTVLALVGPNGAGKSTLLGALSGDLPPSEGEVDFLGDPLERWSTRELARRRAVLLQTNEVSFSFTVRQVVEMGRSPWPPDPARDADAVAHALELTDTAHLTDRQYSSLSGGEKARVSLARVLAQETEVVLLDEPTASLDLRHQEDVMATVRDLVAEGRTAVVVVHDLSLAAAYADAIALLDDGRLVAHGPPDEVLTAAQVADVYRTEVLIAHPDDQLVVVPRRHPHPPQRRNAP